jgi:hypothetical protein
MQIEEQTLVGEMKLVTAPMSTGLHEHRTWFCVLGSCSNSHMYAVEHSGRRCRWQAARFRGDYLLWDRSQLSSESS